MAATIGLNSLNPPVGGSVRISGTVPEGGQSYCLCLVPDGSGTGPSFAGVCILSHPITPPETAYSALFGPIPSGGPYRVLLLDGPCGSQSPAVLATSAPLEAGPEDIPALGGIGFFLLIGLAGTSGYLLVRRFG